jgi:cell division protein FtsB
MNMKLGGYLFTILCLCPIWAHADIYKSVDADGHVTYSSAPLKGGKKIFLEPLPTMLPPAKVQSSEDFPNVDRKTQKARDDKRRKILQDELKAEENLLEVAQQNLKDGKANPEVFKGKDGRTYRNVAKYDAKIKQLNDQVDLHQQNVDALKAELSKLKDE